MKYLSLFLVPFAVGILVPIILSLTRKSNIRKESKMNKYDFMICFPFVYVWIAVALAIGLTAIVIALNISGGANLAVDIIGIPFIVFIFFGAYAVAREKIVIKNDVITVTPIFGRTKTFNFSDIKILKKTSWSNGMISYKVCGDKAMFSISDINLGCSLFMERVEEAKIEICARG